MGLAQTADALLEDSVVGSFSRIGLSVQIGRAHV